MSQITERALSEALQRILLTKPLGKVTVTEIAEECGVNRMTFYYHFRDIYDLVEWTCRDFAERALGENKTYDTWQQGFLAIFGSVGQHKAFVTSVYHSMSREQLERYLYDVTYDLLIGVVEEESAGLDVSDDEKAFIADFYKYGFVGMMLAWIRDGMREDPEQIVGRLSVMAQGNFRKALCAFAARGGDGSAGETSAAGEVAGETSAGARDEAAPTGGGQPAATDGGEGR